VLPKNGTSSGGVSPGVIPRLPPYLLAGMTGITISDACRAS